MMGANVQLLKNFLAKPSPPSFPLLIHTAEHKAMPLVKQGVRALQLRKVAVLGASGDCKSVESSIACDQAVRRQEFVVIAEALAQVGGKSVVNRAAVGVVGVHIAEGDAVSQRGRIASGVAGPSAAENRLRQCHAGRVRGGSTAPAMAGFSPDGRKKFDQRGAKRTRLAAGIDAAMELAPQRPHVSGLVPASAALDQSTAACQFFTSKSPRTVLALIGRFRCRPPLKLYARLKAKPPPKSCSNVRFACSRIRVHEILGLRITERLEHQRQKRRRIQVILIDEQRIGGEFELKRCWIGLYPQA